METLVQPVELKLLDGRSVPLRLNQAVLFRAQLATGIDVGAWDNLPQDQQAAYMFRAIYEGCPLRTTLGYADFEDLLNVAEVIRVFPILLERFVGKAELAEPRPLPESASVGLSDGQSGATISDSPTQSSGN